MISKLPDLLDGYFSDARNSLSRLGSVLESVQTTIDEERLLPDEMTSELQNALDACSASKLVLTEAVAKYSVPAGASLSEMARAISEALDQKEIRDILTGYFRLTAEADTVFEKLNESKAALQSKCTLSAEQLAGEITPYRIVVEQVQSNSEFTDEQYDAVEAEIGRTVARALDRGEISMGDLSVADEWYDDSCDLLRHTETVVNMPVHEAEEQKESEKNGIKQPTEISEPEDSVGEKETDIPDDESGKLEVELTDVSPEAGQNNSNDEISADVPDVITVNEPQPEQEAETPEELVIETTEVRALEQETKPEYGLLDKNENFREEVLVSPDERVSVPYKLTEDEKNKVAQYTAKAISAFASERFDVGSVILQSLSKICGPDSDAAKLYERYAFAMHDPMLNKDYRISNMQMAFDKPCGSDLSYDVLAVAAHLYMFFSDDAAIEYTTAISLQLPDNLLLKKIPDLNDLLHNLSYYVRDNFTGINRETLEIFGSRDSSRTDRQNAAKEAENFAGDYLLKTNHGYTRLIENRRNLFGSGTYIRKALDAVINDDTSRENDVACALELVKNRPTQLNIENLIDEIWPKSASGKDKQNLTGCERGTLSKQLMTIFDILMKWLEAVRIANGTHKLASVSVQKLVGTVYGNLKSVREALANFAIEKQTIEEEGAVKILLYAVDRILKRFAKPDAEQRAKESFYIHLLEYPKVAVDDDFLPLVEEPEEETAPFDFCCRACEYLEKPRRDWSQVIPDFFTREIPGDFGCAEALRKYLERNGKSDVWPKECTDLTRWIDAANNPRGKAKDTLQYWMQDFSGRLDMADGDEWFQETDSRSRKQHIIDLQKEKYVSYYNFGFCVRAMKRVIADMTAEARKQGSEYSEQLKNVRENSNLPKDARIYELAEKMIEKCRFGAFRSYLQMAEKGEEDVSDSMLSDQRSYYQQFVSLLPELCSKTTLTAASTMMSVFNRSHYNTENSTGKTAKVMIANWPESNNASLNERVRSILEAMGLKVGRAVNDNGGIRVTFAAPGLVESYPHPVADFGSRMYTDDDMKKLHVDVLFGNLNPDVVVSKVNDIMQKNPTAGAFVIMLNCTLTLPDRRKIANTIATGPRQRPFVLLDRSLLLFLTKFPQAERWKVLLQCALPFQMLNPYSENSVDRIPPEMFIGRDAELEKIRSFSGANLVYGGRQLGKTALLQRACALEHHPENGKWAIFEDIKGMDISEAASRIGRTLAQKGFLSANKEVSDWNQLMYSIEDRLNGGHDSLLLLLDESDVFLAKSKESEYSEIDAVKRLQVRMEGRFKCVMAGLHNVLRLFNQDALENNSAFAHLEGLTIKPLDFKDARKLFEWPLSYLGFTIREEDEDIIAQILYNTNYFPGLVHFYASRLVEYAKKHATILNEPPYVLKTETLLSLLADQEFHKLRNDRIRMTLYLDQHGKEHSYYEILATVLCYGYNSNEFFRDHGMTAEEMKRECISLEPGCSISKLSDEQIKTILDELKELNILREEDNRYQFRRASFTEIFDSPEKVEEKLLAILMKEDQ